MARAWLLGGALSAFLGAAAAATGACSPEPFACTTAVNCINASNEQGVCVSGYCAYPDPTCPTTHERYSESAGDDLANECVPVEPVSADGGSTDATPD
jgi:hypothetical protein